MGYVLSAVARVLEQPTAWGAVCEMALLAGPLWAAALLGLLLGWAWRPRWAAGLIATADRHPAPPFATLDFWRAQLPTRLRAPLGYYAGADTAAVAQQQQEEASLQLQGSSEMANEELAVGKDDLVNLWRLVAGRDGGPAWIKMMEKALPTMTYQAWRRDPQTGPPQYQSSTIFENATPDEVRDFFGDDEFRMSNKWDDMLIYHKTLEGCQTTGTMKVHWVRKFPFFCSDREYIIARRIWKLGGAYYCVTKEVQLLFLKRAVKFEYYVYLTILTRDHFSILTRDHFSILGVHLLGQTSNSIEVLMLMLSCGQREVSNYSFFPYYSFESKP